MQVRLLQWNVWVNEKPERIAAEIKRFGVDIVLAQELFENTKQGPPVNSADEIAKVLGWSYIYKPAETWDNKPSKTSQGNAIFSRFPINSSRSKHVQKPKPNSTNASDEGRLYLEAQIAIGSQMLTYGTTHLSYTPYFKTTPSRIVEAYNLVGELQKHTQKYILSGDLNASPSSKVFKMISQTLTHAGPDLRQPSWTTKPFDHGEFKEDKLIWRLDYVFTTPDVKVTKAEIVDTKVSDHLPIRVEIEV